MNRSMLFLSLAWAIALYVLHSLAVEHSLYWMIWWYDIPMHLIGGAVLGGLSAWFAFSCVPLFHKGNPHTPFILALVGVLVGGIAWEIFEYRFSLFYHPHISYALDTFKDLIMDMIGGFSVIKFSRKNQIASAMPHE